QAGRQGGRLWGPRERSAHGPAVGDRGAARERAAAPDGGARRAQLGGPGAEQPPLGWELFPKMGPIRGPGRAPPPESGPFGRSSGHLRQTGQPVDMVRERLLRAWRGEIQARYVYEALARRE